VDLTRHSFTDASVVDPESRYKPKSIDVVMYLLGDLSCAWVQAGTRWLGFGVGAPLSLGHRQALIDYGPRSPGCYSA
jgi:hypothetical protein